jgi:hypothetical protein
VEETLAPLAGTSSFGCILDVEASRPLLLLLAATIVLAVVQSWRLRRQRELGRTADAAAAREEERHVAAHARSLRAVDGEVEAGGLLARAGYTVLARRAAGSWTLRANGVPATFGLCADYLVVREGRRYIAEVKTGRLAPRLSHGPTRRQLLEYSAAFDVHGVILVDADLETITHVEVDVFGERASRRTRWPHAGTFAIGAVLLAVGVFVGSATRIGADLRAVIESVVN